MGSLGSGSGSAAAAAAPPFGASFPRPAFLPVAPSAPNSQDVDAVSAGAPAGETHSVSRAEDLPDAALEPRADGEVTPDAHMGDYSVGPHAAGDLACHSGARKREEGEAEE